MNETSWPYPGSRWWTFDFHTHTPASKDTIAWQTAIGTPDEVMPRAWLLRFMAARVDCVAITDHNSGAWIDRLQTAYDQMRQQTENGEPPEGFRELALFPGVEISVNAGFHLLAIFDPSATTRTITDLLAAVRYQGTDGSSDGTTQASAVDVVGAVLDAGGIPIPAHADQDKGLLRVNLGTRECALDPLTVRQVMGIDDLLATEWLDATLSAPDCVEKEAGRLAKVLGSDCHSFQGNGGPGSRYTWIKMAGPTLEGLHLALLDGAGVSVRRSDEGAFEPFQTPAHFVTGIELESARLMGNGTPERLAFTPYYNALIGGRGTGKSTVVHALRLGYKRDEELRHLGEDTEPYRQFMSFAQSVKGRDGDGALRDNTEIRVELMREGIPHRLRWRRDEQGVIVEEQSGGVWRASVSDAVTAERFPVRLFSQGHIAAMAGENRQALLDIIDEASEVGGERERNFEEAKRTWFTQQARLRELDGRLEGQPELERKLADLKRKLDTLAESHHTEVLEAHQRALSQRHEVCGTLRQLRAIRARIQSLAKDLVIEDWPEDAFDPETDEDAIAWQAEIGQALCEAQKAIAETADGLTKRVQALRMDTRLEQWRQRADQARSNCDTLRAKLAEQGVHDADAFGRLERERQQISAQLKQLEQLRKERESLETDSQAKWHDVLTARKAITSARQAFVGNTLATNRFVRMEVVGFGFEARNIERSLRELLDVQDDRFESDILRFDGGEPSSGLAWEVAHADDRDAALEDVKRRMMAPDDRFHGHFRNYLQRQLEKPEFADHVRCWFPEDDLRIEYSRAGDGRDWSTITQGSQGQRAAALLAFLLAFGDEPLILDQPEDDLDNHLIYKLIVRQIRENKLRRQLIIVTHNPNVVVNGDAELVHVFDFRAGQCQVVEHGALQEKSVREEVCRVMEGGREAFARRWKRLGREV